MNKIVKLIIAIAAITSYFLVLRYIAPSREPYFIIGIGLIGLISWFYGIIAGLIIALLLIPSTLYIYSQFSISTSYVAFSSSPAYIALEIFTATMLGLLRKKMLILSQKEADLEKVNDSTVIQGKQDGNIRANAKLSMFNEITDENIDTT